MPTPFYHINVAEELRRHPALGSEARVLLNEQCSPFLLGNTAPDVHVMSGQTRQATHFFTLPLGKNAPHPWDLVIAQNSSLLTDTHLPRARLAFIAGYLCHLQADWLWVRDVFIPTFGPQCAWSTFENRLYLHNALRAYLDKKVILDLPSDIFQTLRQAKPQQWLPFILDWHLAEWRDYLSDQLAPGAMDLTVEIFAVRQGIPPDHYHHLIGSDARMDEEIFVHLPRVLLQEYHDTLIDMNMCLLNDFLAQNHKTEHILSEGMLEAI